MTRVRRFQQDDAHIFCTASQVRDEIMSCIDFMNYVYGMFGFTFSMELSTRPEKYIGDIEVWDRAEKQLEAVLNEWFVKMIFYFKTITNTFILVDMNGN